MLLDIKNESIEDNVKELELTLDNGSSVQVKNLPKRCTLIGLKEY